MFKRFEKLGFEGSVYNREGGRRVVCVWVLVLVGLIGAGVYISNGGVVCVCFV